jgi:arylsulfatase A-like enzyme
MSRAVRMLWIAGLAWPAAANDAVSQGRRPNVVVIVADDMGYGDIGAYGGRELSTPNLDALAAGSVRFTDAYVSGPYCSPTRAGLLTGRYPQRFGHEFNIGSLAVHREVGLPVDQATLADRLKAAGYRTALIGKWHLGSAQRFFPTRRGFDEFFGFLGGAHSYLAATPQVNPIFDGTERVPAIPYLTDALADRAVAFITRNASQPFFLYLAFNAVHVPMHATSGYLARFPGIANETRRTYAAMLSAMDDAIGRTLAALRAASLEENTLIFFFSDNGGPMGDQSWNGSSNTPLRGDKGDTWEGGIRVPFLMRWKGRLPEGKTESRPIIQLDVLPTALAAAGVPPAPEWKLDGVNLLPYLTGTASGQPHEALYWRTGAAMAVRMGDWKLVKSYEGASSDEPGRLSLSGAALFNLARDIGETNDLAAAEPAKLAELASAWQRWNRELAPPGWPSAEMLRAFRRTCDAGAPAPAAGTASYAGTWRGQIYSPAADTALVSWTWIQGADSGGTFTAARDTTPLATRIVAATPDSLVMDLTGSLTVPRFGLSGEHVRIVAQVCGDEMTGVLSGRLRAGGTGRTRITAMRARP